MRKVIISMDREDIQRNLHRIKIAQVAWIVFLFASLINLFILLFSDEVYLPYTLMAPVIFQGLGAEREISWLLYIGLAAGLVLCAFGFYFLRQSLQNRSRMHVLFGLLYVDVIALCAWMIHCTDDLGYYSIFNFGTHMWLLYVAIRALISLYRLSGIPSSDIMEADQLAKAVKNVKASQWQ